MGWRARPSLDDAPRDAIIQSTVSPASRATSRPPTGRRRRRPGAAVPPRRRPGPRRIRAAARPPRASSDRRAKTGSAGVNRGVSPEVPNPVSCLADSPEIPIPNPLSTASLRVQPRRNAAARSGPAIAANASCSAAVKNDATIRSASRDRPEPLEVHADLAAVADGDDPQVGRMRDVEAERFDDARPSIELGLAHGGGPEPQRAGRLAQQSSQDLAEGRPAPGEPPAFACPHEPRGPHPLVIGEDRQLRARLGRIDIGTRRKSGIELDDPGPDLAGLEARDVRAGLPFPQRGTAWRACWTRSRLGDSSRPTRSME